jgi:hypothetical protein
MPAGARIVALVCSCLTLLAYARHRKFVQTIDPKRAVHWPVIGIGCGQIRNSIGTVHEIMEPCVTAANIVAFSCSGGV